MTSRLEITVLRWIVTSIVVCAFLVVNYFIPRFWHSSETVWLVAGGTGLCVGQINLIAMWAALAPGNLMLRLPWSLLLTVLMWYAFVLGNRRISPHFSLDEAVTLGLILLFAVLFAQIPLWIAAKVFRWRMVSWAAGAARMGSEDYQFHLRDVLIGMLFLSLALAPARLVLPPGDASPRLDDDLWILLPLVAVCNLLITVPAIWVAFLEAARLTVMAFAWLFYCGIVSVVELVVIDAVFGGADDGESLFLVFMFNFSQTVAVLATLLIFRALGFQLRRTPGQRISENAPP